MDLFIFEDYSLRLNKVEILLVKEFADLWEASRNRGDGDTRGVERKRAFKEFTHMYLAHDWKSPYSEFSSQERDEAALIDSGLTKKQLEDEKFLAACKKYLELQDTRMLKLLKSAYKGVDELMLWFTSTNLQEVDPMTGKPIHSAKDMIANIANLGKTVEGLQELEYLVKKDKDKERGLRGGQQPGMFD